MKKTLSILMIAIMMVAFFACKKKSDTTTPAVLSASFSSKIGGTTWTATAVSAGYMSGTFTIAAVKSSETMGLSFAGTGTGTYSFDSENNWGIGTVGSSSFSSLYATEFGYSPSGQVVITKWDATAKLVSGTFSYDAYDFNGTLYHVTAGQFSNVPTVVQ
jgi:hypothetical protein